MNIIKKSNSLDCEVKWMLVVVFVLVLLFWALFSNLSNVYDKAYKQCIENANLSDIKCQQLARNAQDKAATQAATGSMIGVIAGSKAPKR